MIVCITLPIHSYWTQPASPLLPLEIVYNKLVFECAPFYIVRTAEWACSTDLVVYNILMVDNN